MARDFINNSSSNYLKFTYTGWTWNASVTRSILMWLYIDESKVVAGSNNYMVDFVTNLTAYGRFYISAHTPGVSTSFLVKQQNNGTDTNDGPIVIPSGYDKTWIPCLIVWDRTATFPTMKLYIRYAGTTYSMTSTQGAGKIAVAGDPSVYLGTDYVHSASRWANQIAEVCMWDTEISQASFETYLTSTPNPTLYAPGNVLGYWSLHESDPTTGLANQVGVLDNFTEIGTVPAVTNHPTVDRIGVAGNVPLILNAGNWDQLYINSQDSISLDLSAAFDANGGTILATGGYAETLTGDDVSDIGLSLDVDTGIVSGTVDATASTVSPITVYFTAENENGASSELPVTFTVRPAIRITATDNKALKLEDCDTTPLINPVGATTRYGVFTSIYPDLFGNTWVAGGTGVQISNGEIIITAHDDTVEINDVGYIIFYDETEEFVTPPLPFTYK